jgi:DNA-binding CsgD family transcriptional regulator
MRGGSVTVPELSLTEERIVLLLSAGWSPMEIAIDVGLDERAVEWHLARATGKLRRVSILHERIRKAAMPPKPSREER